MGMYCGIDLHATNSFLCVIDESGQARLEAKVPNRLDAVRSRLEPFRDELQAVAVESTFNWYWLVDGLAGAGYPMRLANPSAMKRYEGLKYSDDRHDARWIAELLRLWILPTGYIYPCESRPLRDLLRHRARLVRNRTARLLTFQNLLARETGRQITGNELKRFTPSDLSALGLSRETQLAVSGSLEIIALLDEKILEIEKVVVRGVKGRVELKLLRTVGGIGQALGLTILLETGESPASARSATMPPTDGWYLPNGAATSARRARAIASMATHISPGPSQKRRSLLGDSSPKPVDSSSASGLARTSSSPTGHSLTSWPALATSS